MGDSNAIGLSREAWGPRFWKLFHTLAECSGIELDPLTAKDELDAWIVLLKVQYHVMPCKLCKEHYKQWYSVNPIDQIRSFSGLDRKKEIRNWLWGCHSAVNFSNGKPVPPLDTLPLLYQKQSVEKEVSELNTMFQLAMSRHILKLEDITRWRIVVKRLRGIYGL